MVIQAQINIKIETYWNVNTSVKNSVRLLYEIKIETYWNVNTVLSLASAGAMN